MRHFVALHLFYYFLSFPIQQKKIQKKYLAHLLVLLVRSATLLTLIKKKIFFLSSTLL